MQHDRTCASPHPSAMQSSRNAVAQARVRRVSVGSALHRHCHCRCQGHCSTTSPAISAHQSPSGSVPSSSSSASISASTSSMSSAFTSCLASLLDGEDALALHRGRRGRRRTMSTRPREKGGHACMGRLPLPLPPRLILLPNHFASLQLVAAQAILCAAFPRPSSTTKSSSNG